MLNHLQDMATLIATWLPLVVACVAIFNAIMTGIYAALGSLLDAAKSDLTSNKYLVRFGGFAKAGMKILDIIGFHKPHKELKEQIYVNKDDISDLKQEVK